MPMEFLGLFLAAGMACAATCLGAAGVFAFRKIDCRLYSAIIALCAGVMAFSAAEMLWQSQRGSGLPVTLTGMAAGVLIFLAIERTLPHLHLLIRRRRIEDGKKKAAMMVGTITLHNIPEGFAIAAAYAASPALGWLVAGSIALQDVPEGLVVSVPAACCGVGMRRSFFWGALSGVVEMAAAVAGFAFLSIVAPAIPFALAFSGGAMAYVSLFELLPDTLRDGEKLQSALLFFAGIALAALLAVAFAVQ